MNATEVVVGNASRQFENLDVDAFYEMQQLLIELGVISVRDIIVPPGTQASADRVIAAVDEQGNE